MSQSNLMTQQLVTEHQQRLMHHAEKQRRAQDLIKAQPTRKIQRLVAKLGSEMSSLNKHDQTATAQER